MAHSLDKITIKGFKSIQSLEDFELTNLNVLIGGNGAGKSNFIDFFRMLRAMMDLPIPGLPTANMQAYFRFYGGIHNVLYNGHKVTKQIEAELMFGGYGYRFALNPTADETCIFDDESYYNGNDATEWKSWGSGHSHPKLVESYKDQSRFFKPSSISKNFKSMYSRFVYHFNDTSDLASMRRSESVDDNLYLRFDASNIASYLLRIKNEDEKLYQKISSTIQLVAPFFDDFILKPDENEKVRLMWKQKGSDMQLKPYHLSDGTIRFICLTTALMQLEPPATIIIDEPELGLHPYAIDIMAEMIHSASQKVQVIVSTQSSALIDNLEPENVIVVNRKDGASTYERLNKKEFTSWLEEYSLGELWYKNVVAGGPVHE